MKNIRLIFLTIHLLFVVSIKSYSQVPCNLNNAYIDIPFPASSITMIANVNGNSQYSYQWSNGINSSINQFYSNWCVNITDLISGCDTIICESCIPSGGFGICPMIYAPVCGCDGNIYSNDCIAMYNGIFSYTSAIGPNGQLLPCNNLISNCTVSITSNGLTTFCSSDSVQLYPNIFDSNGTYMWNTGISGQHHISNNHEIWVDSSGIYFITYTNDTGCVAIDSVTVNVLPEPIITVNTIPSPPEICLGDSLIIELNSGMMHYYWNTGNPFHQDQNIIEVYPTNNFTYICEAIDSNGCYNKAEIFVLVDTCISELDQINLYDLIIYPVPSKDWLFISTGVKKEFDITIFDFYGRIILKRDNLFNNKSVNIKDINKGNYILRIEFENTIINKFFNKN
tara:strand:- start:18746 stop:19933 length:1188 start_codon:yes stop_codon:yes gene_type:complete